MMFLMGYKQTRIVKFLHPLKKVKRVEERLFFFNYDPDRYIMDTLDRTLYTRTDNTVLVGGRKS